MNKKSLIISSLLGDGYITHDKDNKRYFAIQHGDKQKDYLLYKKKLFEDNGFKVKYNKINKSNARNFIGHRITIYADEFQYWERLFYPNKNRTVTRHLLNMLDEQGLAIWWQDDGSLTIYTNPKDKRTHRSGKLCTHAYTYEENKIIEQYLNVIWKLDVRIKIEKKKYYYIYFNTNSLIRLFKIISPYVVESMKYKIDMQYVKPQLSPILQGELI